MLKLTPDWKDTYICGQVATLGIFDIPDGLIISYPRFVSYDHSLSAPSHNTRLDEIADTFNKKRKIIQDTHIYNLNDSAAYA